MKNIHSDLKHKTHICQFFLGPVPHLLEPPTCPRGPVSQLPAPDLTWVRKMEGIRQEHLPSVTPVAQPSMDSVPSGHRLPSVCWWPLSAACLPKDLVLHLSPGSDFTNLSSHRIIPLNIHTHMFSF